MYPSKQYPHYGVFVQNIEKSLLASNFNVKKCVLTKSDNKFLRLSKYVIFYLMIILKGLFINYDFIYAHYASHVCLPLLIIKFIRKKTYIITNVHGNDIVPESPKDEKFIPYVKKLLKESNYIISPSEYFKEVLKNNYHIDDLKIFVSPSGGINHLTFYKHKDKEMIYKKFNLNPNKKYIGYVSRIEINKGWDIFLDACSIIIGQNQDVEIIVVGGGDEETLFNERVKQNNLEKYTHKMGLMSQQDIAEIFSVLDIFCFPTRRKSESLGLVGLEAMACQSIVIASSCYGPSSYLKNNYNGFTFDMNSSDDLACKILNALELTPLEKQNIAKNAYNTSLLYDSEKVNSELIDFFDQL